MNPNPTIDNDLQKAIDDITKNTNEDPVFGEPVATPAPAPPAPKPTSFPEVGMPPAPKPVAAPTFRPAPAPMPKPASMPPKPAGMPPKPMPKPVEKPEFAEEVVEEEEKITPEEAPSELRDVKEAVLRDLAPIIDKIDMDPSKKFDLYKNIHEELHDDSVIASAYEVSKEIADDNERADALLYLYDSLK